MVLEKEKWTNTMAFWSIATTQLSIRSGLSTAAHDLLMVASPNQNHAKLFHLSDEQTLPAKNSFIFCFSHQVRHLKNRLVASPVYQSTENSWNLEPFSRKMKRENNFTVMFATIVSF